MAVQYKLYYFDARGRGELIRLIFHAAGEEFEDIRVHQGMWEKLKIGMPFQTLPALEFEGQQLFQSMSIARYLAGLFDLSGKSNLEKALVDSAADLVDEVLSDTLKVIFEPEKKYKERALKKFVSTTLPKKLDKLEQFKVRHGHGYGYIVGNDIQDLVSGDSFIKNPYGEVDNRRLLRAFAAKYRERLLVYGFIAARVLGTAKVTQCDTLPICVASGLTYQALRKEVNGLQLEIIEQ